MDEGNKQFGNAEIRKVGPLWVVEGGIILYPVPPHPLVGYEANQSEGISELFMNLEKLNHEWWEKFPNCCDSHKRFNSTPGFDKSKFSFVKDQAHLSVRYFVHCLEMNLDSPDWFQNITDYYDYLFMNFGSPGWGEHIFKWYAEYVIENITFKEVDFTDDQRIILLDHISPARRTIEERKKNSGKLEDLYFAFQNWLEVMPAFGEIAHIKQKLSGKVPMNIFVREIKVNKYNGLASSSIKTVAQLVKDLKGFTQSLLLAVQDTIEDEYYRENKTMLSLSEEKLRIRQAQLFSTAEKVDPEIYELIIEWLGIWIDYFKEFMLSSSTEKILNHVKEGNDYIRKALESYDVLSLEIAELKSIVNASFQSINEDLLSKLEKRSATIVEGIDDTMDHELEEIQANIYNGIGHSNSAIISAKSKIQKSQISVKSKIKLSLPIFLFTKYEAEIELGASDKIPSNLTELKRILLYENSPSETKE